MPTEIKTINMSIVELHINTFFKSILNFWQNYLDISSYNLLPNYFDLLLICDGMEQEL